MKNKSLGFLLLMSFLIAMDFPQQEGFREEFDSDELIHFKYGSTGKTSKFKWKIGEVFDEENKGLSFKLHPREKAGPGKGPELISKDFTHFGTYSARLKVPDPRKSQPQVGAVVGLFTYHEDKVLGLSEIDFEWRIADPRISYVGTWTGKPDSLRRVGRTINLAEGIIYTSEERLDYARERKPLTDTSPQTIEAIPDFDASSQFHTYGFDWNEERVRWWMIHPVSADTLILWDYQGENGIPQHPSKYRINFWHTANWGVKTKPEATEAPKRRYELQVDWMEYRPTVGF